MCHSAKKTKQCFFFALRYLIGLASVVFKPSSTKIETEVRDKGKATLFFNNFNSNLTKSLQKREQRRLIVVKIPRLRQQSSNSVKP